ncbi:hypothetical protein [Pedobacter sp. KBW06]|uniref:hypothetical protein n=1 Tax=Pedobacter sp. KBW06 TaxID=2153359 RepID=UPI000F5A6385|nr:hypothetical protein [Pedobacter sp. KBW06]
MFLFPPFNKKNAVSVLTSLVGKLNMPVSPATTNSSLHVYPGYLSLPALCDCPTEWKIPNGPESRYRSKHAYKVAKVDQISSDIS